jgi:hypothetical protein
MSLIHRLQALFVILASASLMYAVACGQQPAQQAAAPQEAAPPPAPATPEEQLAQVKKQLEDLKMAMANEGKYACCVEPACDWCLLTEGECKCRDNIEAGKEVCAGCGLGWHNGQGNVEGVDSSKVKWNISHSHETAESEHKH